MTFLAQALLSFFFTALLIVWLRRPALRFGLVDQPGGRKKHGDTVPLTGGIALTLGFFLALAVSFHALGEYRVLLVSMALLGLIGLLDDLGEVSARAKLGVQVMASVLMTSWGNHFLVDLGDLFGLGQIDLKNWAIPLTVFATVAVINGINMFDGVDGLAGSLVLVMLAYFALFVGWVGDLTALKPIVVLIGAIAGFLLFNAPIGRRRRRVFMGDTGALVLGLFIVWFAVELTQKRGAEPPTVPPVVMLWVVGLVLFDVFTVTVRRLLRRRDPAAPDRAHIHHLLLRRGYSPAQTTLVLVAANTLLAAIGTVAWQQGVSEHWLFAAFLLLGLLFLAVFLYPGRFMRAGRRRRTT